MKKVLSILFFICFVNSIYCQTDDCALAPLLAVTPNCGTPIVGSSSGATQSLAGCVGTADDDVWYKFVATGTSHSITVTGAVGYDPVVEVLSGSCSNFTTSIACIDNTLSGEAEAINLTGLTIGGTYYIRIFHFYAGSGSGTFTICLTNPPPPPANDNCTGASSLTVNSSCNITTGTTYGATQSFTSTCSGTADDDVWYKFTANSYTQTINVTGSTNMDPVVELYTGACTSFTTGSSIDCADNTFIGGVETINAVGLVIGQTYYIRIYDYYTGGGYSYSVCVVGNNVVSGTQPNDEPC